MNSTKHTDYSKYKLGLFNGVELRSPKKIALYQQFTRQINKIPTQNHGNFNTKDYNYEAHFSNKNDLNPKNKPMNKSLSILTGKRPFLN